MDKKQRIKLYSELQAKFVGFENYEIRLEEIGFFEKPASLNHHGNMEGGLFAHSYQVARSLIDLTERLELKWQHKRSPFIVGIMHDLCKCYTYQRNMDNGEYIYNPNVIFSGHGSLSVVMAQDIIGHLTDEEAACIMWHMGAFEKDTKNWEYYGNAVKKYPNVLYTHTADMIASKIMGV